MRVLFVHQNAPGQYLHLVDWATKTQGITPVAITAATNQRADLIPTLRYNLKVQTGKVGSPSAERFAQSVARGEAAAKAAIHYRDRGFKPDVIFGHGAWGETFYLKEVFPDAKLICYAEFYYRSRGQNIGFDPEFDQFDPNSIRTVSSQNATMTTSLLGSDIGQVPTQFQANTFPEALRAKLSIVFDGIDTNVIKPNPGAQFSLEDGRILKAGDPVITFINRNLEPYRGYHTFMRALPAILAADPTAQVLIVGGDSVSYGPPAPGGDSWKSIFLKEVSAKLDLSRVHFLGQVSTSRLLQIYQVSAAHVYLTYPFVLSWSMLEAMSAGCVVIGSDVAPVREAIAHGETGLLTDFFDADALANSVLDVLHAPQDFAHIRAAARAHIVENYDLNSICLPAQKALIDAALVL